MTTMTQICDDQLIPGAVICVDDIDQNPSGVPTWLKWTLGVGAVLAVGTTAVLIARRASAAPEKPGSDVTDSRAAAWDVIDASIAEDIELARIDGHDVTAELVADGSGVTALSNKPFAWRTYRIDVDGKIGFSTAVIVQQPDGTYLYDLQEDPQPSWMATDTATEAAQIIDDWAANT